MTSKNLFFKLMKEDFKRRLWVVTLIGLASFFAYPVAAAFMAGNINDYYGSYEWALLQYTQSMQVFLDFDNAMTCFGMVVASVICGLSSFSYLNSRSKVDFYHGIPVRREKLYLANYLGGILYLAVPYGICLAIAVVVGMANGVSGSLLCPIAVRGYLLHMVYYTLMYTVTVIAAMMTGNLVIGLLGTAVFNFIVPLAVSLVQGYYLMFYHTYLYVAGTNGDFFQWGIRISPLAEYIYQMEEADPLRPQATLLAALGALGVSLVLAAVGCMLYKKRPSEAAGKAMAFHVSKPIIRIILTLISGLGLGAFFWSIRSSMGWAVFGILCGTVICHCVVEIIYHFDFKKLFSNWRQLAGCTVVVLAVFCVFRYDLTGYDQWVPSAEKVKETGIYLDRINQWVSYGNLVYSEEGGWYWAQDGGRELVLQQMHYQDTENILEIVREGVRKVEENREEEKRGGFGNNENSASSYSVIGGADGPTAIFVAGKVGDGAEVTETGTQPRTWSSVLVCYTLNSGRKVYRKYYICLERVLPQVERMMADEAYQSVTYPVMSRSGEDVAVVRYREGEESVSLTELTPQQKAELLAVYKKELGAMSLTRMYGEAPIGLIRFTSEEEERGLLWIQNLEDSKIDLYDSYSSRQYRYRRYGVWNEDYYPVYPSFDNTLSLLREFKVDAGNYINAPEITSLQVEKEYYDEYGQWDDSKQMLFMGREEIEKLLEVVEDGDLLYYNPCYQAEDYCRGTVNYVINGQNSSRSILFPKGGVPDFVEEQLDAEREQEDER